MKPRVLIIDDDEMVTGLVKEILRQEYDVESCDSSAAGAEMTGAGNFDIVLSDLKMPGLDGIGVLKRVKELSPKTAVLIMTGFASIDTAVEAIKLGAFDYIAKPFDIDYLKQKIENALGRQKLKEEVADLKDIVSIYEVSKALSSSIGLRQILKLILDISCKQLKADSGSVMLMDESKQELFVGAHVGLNEAAINNTRVKLGDKISGWVAEKKETILLTNGLKNDIRFHIKSSRSEIKSSMVTVLKSGDEVLGVLSLNSFKSVEFFNEKTLKIFSIFAHNAEIAIKEARTYDLLSGLHAEVERLAKER